MRVYPPRLDSAHLPSIRNLAPLGLYLSAVPDRSTTLFHTTIRVAILSAGDR